jgi:hypothetical protein
VLVPSRDLWPAISSRIDAPVIPLAPRRAAGSTVWHRVRLGAIAAGLMGVTALATYWLTKQQTAPAVAVAPAPNAPSLASPEPGTANVHPDSAVVSPGREVALTPGGPARASAPARSTVSVARRERADAQTTYDSEITQLRGVLTQRTDELDPSTVAIIENSLKTIDTAIAEARAALLRDPASRFLSSQLNKALEKKLGVLRTAALLPART